MLRRALAVRFLPASEAFDDRDVGLAAALAHRLETVAATGTRLMTTLLHELERTGGRYGLQTMCEGGGQANVTIIERL